MLMAGEIVGQSLLPEAGVTGGNDMAEPLLTDSARLADSIADAHANALLSAASDKYKNIKFIQYEGTTEANLYPEVISTQKAILEAMANERLSTTDQTRLRSMLFDIDPLLVNGAVYYSSEGNSAKMNEFAVACVDARMIPDMQDMPYLSQTASLYPSLVYCAASQAYNAGEQKKALGYFEEYFRTGASDRLEQIAMFYGQACLNQACPERGVDRLIEATNRFPANYNLLMVTLQNCLDAGKEEKMMPLLERAVLMRPDDEQLLNVQAALYEREGNYAGALDIYTRIFELHPTSISVNKHMALCYYNLGVECYNRGLTADNEKDSKKYARQAKAYLNNASLKLGAVVDAEPSNPKYLKALAMTYGCLGESSSLQQINSRLSALGYTPVAINGMPEAVTYDDQTAQGGSQNVPAFQDYAKSFVEEKLAEWCRRREFEKKEDFEKRVSQNNVYMEYQRLCKEAEGEYLKKYASKIRISDLTLEPYDIDNESYLITSKLGDMVISVPLKNNEAEAFKSQWNAVQIRNPKFYIQNNQVAIASIEFVTPAKKTYSFNAANAATYDFTEVGVDVGSFLAQGNAARKDVASKQTASGSNVATVIRAKSDVDKDIPITSRKSENAIALIWANENYKNVSDVASALNDGETFAQYCKLTLGIPDSQVILLENATYAEMLGSVNKLRQLAGALPNCTDIIFYYAGHGIPDEATKDSYLLPVDGDGVMTVVTYPLKKLYDDLTSMRADNVMAFIDACFSGATRDGSMLAEARGVALKPKTVVPEGNMFVLTAASDQETALPYTEKNHGLFTYFLLKKLQESKGNVTLKALADYVQDNVKKNSLTINQKIQTPSVSVSGKMADDWDKRKIRQ